MDEHKRREMDKMNDMFGMPYSISVEDQPYPVLCIMLRKILPFLTMRNSDEKQNTLA